MTIYLGKSCSFRLLRVPFVNCRQFMYLVISLFIGQDVGSDCISSWSLLIILLYWSSTRYTFHEAAIWSVPIILQIMHLSMHLIFSTKEHKPIKYYIYKLCKICVTSKKIKKKGVWADQTTWECFCSCICLKDSHLETMSVVHTLNTWIFSG